MSFVYYIGGTLRDLFRDAKREPTRTALTLVGIILGAASIVFLASSLSAAGSALSRISQDASGDDISRVENESPGPIAQSKTTRTLMPSDAKALKSRPELDGAVVGSSITLMHQEASRGGNKRKWVGLQSGGSHFAQLSNLEILHGRWTTDEEETERLCVIGHDVWKDLFEGEWPLPDPTFVLNGSTRLTVVGVLRPRPPVGGGGDGTWMFDRKVWVSGTILKRSLVARDDVDEVAMRHPITDSGLPDLKKIAASLAPYLQNLHLGVKNFEFDALNKRMQTGELVVFALGAIMFACGIIAMLVGGVNVMNAQLVTVHEKTKEYGLRRALGATASSLRRRVILESASYTFLGALIGVLAGLLGARGLSLLLTATWVPWPFKVELWSIGLAIGSALLVGLIAGVIPAIRAGQMQPSESLRSD